MTLSQTMAFLTMTSIITASTVAQAEAMNRRRAGEGGGELVRNFLDRVAAIDDSTARQRAVSAFTDTLIRRGRPVTEDSVVYFFYVGKARRVSVPGDLNSWNLAADTMTRVRGTNLFFLKKTVDRASRIDYKFVVDSTWILDPFNVQQSMSGYGTNSEIWMPGYHPPKDVRYREGIPHGSIDTLYVKSKVLGRTHPVMIYLPPGYRVSRRRYPSLYVMDGGEYLSLGLMNNVLDNLLADGRIRPIVGIFVDPRTDLRDSRTSRRMTDYSMSDAFLRFLCTELRAQLLKKYRIDARPEETGIMGASLGGLIATYACLERPDVFRLCAAQSPAYRWQDEGIFARLESAARLPAKFYIDTGTIHDAERETRRVKQMFDARGYALRYAEYPEGHSWGNWRARISDILAYFWGTGRGTNW